MNHSEYHKTVEQIRDLLEKGKSCSLTDLKGKYQISKRTAIRMIADLRTKGFDIRFDRKENTYKMAKT